MSSLFPSLDQIKSTLMDSDQVLWWRVFDSRSRRSEAYLLKNEGRIEADQNREVCEHQVEIELAVSLGDESQGRVRKALAIGVDIETQVQQMIQLAMLSEEKSWSLMDNGKSYEKQTKAFTSQQTGEVLQGIIHRLEQALEDPAVQQGLFNSAEVFCEHKQVRVLNSAGLMSYEEKARIYFETCFAYRHDQGEDEFMLTEWAESPDQIDILGLCRRSVEGAKQLGQAGLPVSGSYSVLLTSDVLIELFNDLRSQMSLKNRYEKIPYLAPKTELVAGFEGTPFEFYLDPEQDGSFGQKAVTSDGVEQRVTALVKGNQVVESISPVQYATYFGQPPSSSMGCMRIDAECRPMEQVLEDLDRPLLEILQFSGLFTNPMDLTFSSEIRLARIYDPDLKQWRYVKGGNLSGRFIENLKGVQFVGPNKMQNTRLYSDAELSYFGPQAAILSGVSVSS